MANNVNFQFVKIETLQNATFENLFNKDFDIEMGLNTEFKINEIDKSVNVLLDISFFQKETPIVKLKVSCFFVIIEESWNTFLNNNKIIIPQDFARHLLMLTVGTSRGILHTKIEKTVFKDLILPTINLTEIIKDDLTFDEQKM